MSKEELEKEVIKSSNKKCVKGCSKYYRYGYQDGYIDGAEAREKRIEELEQQNNNLQVMLQAEREVRVNADYLKKITELEAKIVHLTQHLEPQAMTTLFEQVEEEVKQEQKIKDLKKENAKLKEEKCMNKTCVVLKDKEDCVAQLLELKKQLTEEQNLNAEIKARFVKCNTCTNEMKKDCLMWTENLCEGERCNELIDIQELIMKGGMIS